ncbi:MAG: MTH938/NDUFAF3 family protein [Actinomycetota bacterium]
MEWGSIETEVGRFRDAKLWPGGGRGWDWRETGTRHDPGILAADVEELIGHGAHKVILGCGQRGRLGVAEEAEAALRAAGVPWEIYESGEAIERYNRAAARAEPVGALIHTTC